MAGRYRIDFETEVYFRRLNVEAFFPIAQVGSRPKKITQKVLVLVLT
jgi:hypothetical protein